MKTLELELKLVRYQALLNSNKIALDAVTTDEECFDKYDMPLYALEDIVNHYVQKVLALQISLGVLVTN